MPVDRTVYELRQVQTGAARFTDYKRIPTDDGRGVKTIEDGATAVEYVALLDARAVYLMAERAYRNKSGKSSAGPITVKILKRVKVVQHGR